MLSESGTWTAPDRRERSGARLAVSRPWPIPAGEAGRRGSGENVQRSIFGRMAQFANSGLTLGDRPRPFPLGLSILYQLVKHAPRRIRQEPLYTAPTLFFQEPHRPRQSSSSSRRTGERVHLAIRLSPDLGSGRLDVGLSVGNIVKLVGPTALSKESAYRLAWWL
jgi:hypothetical protein